MAGVSGKTGMSAIKKKQLMILVGLIAVIGGIAFIAAMLGTPKKAPPPPRSADTTRKTFGAQGEQVSNADVWRTQEGARVTQLQQQLEDMQKKLAAREKQEYFDKQKEEEAKKVEEERKSRAKVEEDAKRAAQVAPPPTGLPMQNQNNLGAPQPVIAAPQPPSGELVKGIMRVDMTGSKAANSSKSGQPANRQDAQNKDESGPNVVGEQSAETYIPAGTFMRGVLLSGLDAPTGGQAQQNPHPVIVEVLDMASLPNKFKADYKNCRLTANGAGDLSSERAYIRLDRLSCISEDGGALDVSIKGYLADQTGKAGVRGRLVSKQGQVLANALLSGVASGIGTAFARSATTTSVSPLGSTESVKDGEEFKAGMGQGVGSALQQLSRYYIKLADKMFPIIEVDAGLPVDIVITRGLSIAKTK